MSAMHSPVMLTNCPLCLLSVNRIKEETKTAIIIPHDNLKKSLIRIEGSPQGVAKAKEEILEMAKKLVSEEFPVHKLWS